MQKLDFVLQQVVPGKDFVALTMDILFNESLTERDYRLAQVVDAYNTFLFELERMHANVKVIDIRDFTRQYPISELVDWKFYFISQMGMNPKLGKSFKVWWERKMKGIALKRKKCLILDLDNTLWGGILGEDGIKGIQIGDDYPGKAFHFWQEALYYLAKSGVILAVCSKNNEKDVFEAWEKNPFMVLRKEAFSAYRINWRDKASNIKELAEELNIGLDSLVFVDDNPSERELIKQMLPMVSVPDFPKQPYMLPDFFKQLVNDYFKVYDVTDEDRSKTEQYKANAMRKQEREKYADLKDYIRSLKIEIQIESMDAFNQSRIAQMTQKTNQFNLTTHRYTESDLSGFIKEGWQIFALRAKDRFGDNGITGTIMLKPCESCYEIDTFLLSCRILGKGIESAFLLSVLNELRHEGIRGIKSSFIPTAKNAQTATFYEQLGFVLERVDESGNKYYHINLDEDRVVEPYYKIIVRK